MKFSFERLKTLLNRDFRNTLNNLMTDLENNFKENDDKFKSVQSQVDTVVTKAGDSGPETLQARVDLSGTSQASLKARLDKEQTDFLNRTAGILNINEFNAAGNGTSNDTTAFTNIETNYTNRIVELNGKTYLVNSLPTKNKYVNGRFLVGGSYTDAPYSSVVRNDHAVVALGVGAASGVPNYPSYSGDKYYKNIAIGGYAMEKSVGSFNNIAIGWQALQNMNKGEFYNIGIGNESLLNTQLTDTSNGFNATRNIGIGMNALRYNVNGHHNVALGRNNLQCTKNGSYNTALGVNAQGGEAPLDLTGNITDYTKYDVNNVTAIGASALLRNVGNNNSAVGYQAGYNLAKAINNAFFGLNAGMNLQKDVTVDGKKKIFSSKTGTYVWSGTTITVTMTGHGFQNGYLVALKLTTGSNLKTTEENQYYIANVTTDTFTITAPLSNSTSGSITSSWYSDNVDNTKSSDNNVIIGNYAMENSQSGNNNVVVGTWAGRNLTSTSNVLIGALAGTNVTTGEKLTGIGYGALRYMQDGTNLTSVNVAAAIGFDSRVSGDNQLQLGGTGVTSYSYGAVQQRSDMRDKADIEDTELGLEFISKLRPRQYRWDYRDDYMVLNEETGELEFLEKDGSKKRSRMHQGLIAQEVKEVMDDLGVDFGGFQDHNQNGGTDVFSIGYEELIGPLIKSIQELKAEVEELKANGGN